MLLTLAPIQQPETKTDEDNHEIYTLSFFSGSSSANAEEKCRRNKTKQKILQANEWNLVRITFKYNALFKQEVKLMTQENEKPFLEIKIQCQ